MQGIGILHAFGKAAEKELADEGKIHPADETDGRTANLCSGYHSGQEGGVGYVEHQKGNVITRIRDRYVVIHIPEERVSIPIECKAALKLYDRHFKNIAHYLNATQQSFGILISAAPFQVKTLGNKTMINLPVYLASGKNIRNYYFRLK
ncbi:hypothetical protein ES705_47263 [subsurface metagenome]